MGRNKKDFTSGGGLDSFVRPSSGPRMINQKASKFEDRRTNRERDRSSKNRNAIARSKNEE